MSPYTSLNASPAKKRVCSSTDDEPTPKRQRIASPTPRSIHEPSPGSLPVHLSRLNNIHSALQRALSYAVATCAVGPSEGKIRNVLNLMSITNYSGFATGFTKEDLKQICWIWEWDPTSLPPPATAPGTEDDPNPFLVSTTSSTSKDSQWTRGSMGCIVSAASHYSRPARKRVPVYGIGIELGPDTNKDMTGGMVPVTKWITNAGNRVTEFQSKLEAWTNLHANAADTPNVPLADLPELVVKNAQHSSFTRAFVPSSREGVAIVENTISGPSSPSKSLSSAKSSTPRPSAPLPMGKARSSVLSPSKPSTSESVPRTPSSRLKGADPLAGLFTPKARKRVEGGEPDSLPVTPVRQCGSDAQTAPSLPSTSRRQAIYDRVRLKELSSTPAKSKSSEVRGGKLTSEQLQKLGDAEIRRRFLLGQLGKIANIIWEFFSSSAGPTAAFGVRRRKALHAEAVIDAVKRSLGTPMSKKEILAALKLLTELCPFFLKEVVIGGEEWLEMPATRAAPTSSTTESSSRTIRSNRSPTKSGCNPAPQILSDDAEQILALRPHVSGQQMGRISAVQEKIEQELNLCNDL